MSADFAVAIQMGATHVRVGSAIFGHALVLHAPRNEWGDHAISPTSCKCLPNHDLRPRPHPPQQPQHRRLRHRDAAGGRRKIVRARCRNTALPRPAMRGVRVVVDLDDEIVEMVVARQPVAGLVAVEPDRLIVVAVVRVLAPGVLGADRTRAAERSAAADAGRRATTIAPAGRYPAACRRRPRACWPGCRRGRAPPAWSSRRRSASPGGARRRRREP